MNRRDFLLTTGMVAAGGVVGGAMTTVSGKGKEKMTKEEKTNLRCIDVHNHMVPEAYVAALAGIGIHASGGMPFPEWRPEMALEVMGKYGIETGILSLSSPGVFFGETEFAVNLARETNEIGANVVMKNPDKFGFFANLPLPLADESVSEAVYALDHLKADGIIMLASSGDKFLGDPEFDDLLAELDKRSAVVFIHPNLHSSSMELGLSMPQFLVEFMFDTTRAVANLLWTGALERYPNIRWIIAHAGATVPYLAWRLSLMDMLPGFKDRVPRGVLYHLKNLYYDTALSPSPFAMAALLQLVNPSQILFGSDFPFAPEILVAKEMDDLTKLPGVLKGSGGLNKKMLKEICRSNALALFPRFGRQKDD